MKRNLRSLQLSVLSAVLAVGATACVKTDNKSDAPVTPPPPAVVTLSSIAVTPAGSTVGIDAKQDYVATGTYSDGTSKDISSEVVWSVVDTTIATISNDESTKGQLTAVALGKTSVVATYTPTDGTAAIVGSADVTVVTATLSGIVVGINSKYGRAPVQFITQLKATGVYSDKSTTDLTDSVTWMGLTPAIGMVSDMSDSKGQLTGVSVGTAKVSASLNGLTGLANVIVSNETLVNITMTPSSVSLPAGKMQQFSCAGNFGGGNYASGGEVIDLTQQVTWASSDESIVTISNDAGTKGQATGQAGLFPGSANVTATSSVASGSVVGTATVSRPLF